ncbi:hyaluronan and proteoglycan link protein 1 [Lacerta agilis]|uniref:hyaluronan and proteoglycan link protein 1 n=1 Tax=Lacerta agilis TaxID=80427 RepID=UPI0014199CA4|nr:hyaluronan and proteoglycan link protein 1 [Lacerta agilis]XP_033020090.1 hyaluronan and proteoglycan link protein 1 [Lacerta agilis]XP_033020091.1 hyaluronan and proteoglycan link protein 1 [Lacerta agilis]
MKSLLFLVLISFCWADHHVANFTLEHDRIIHIHENGPRLLVEADQTKIFSQRGGNVTLPCKFYRDHGSSDSGSHKIRVKWTKLTSDYLKEVDVYVEMGYHKKSYGNYQGRVFLKKSTENDASLVITNIMLEDYGKYKCEVIEGLEDDTTVISLDLEGIVFPYFPRLGRYNLNFHEAQQACLDQDAVIASFDQLYDAWRAGLDWCNAGWLSDGSVQYPITHPREPCGGKNTVPGIRNYGFSNKDQSRYDVFCFTSHFNGRFYYLIHPTKLTYDEAVHACLKDGAQIAKVGQMFAAWKLLGYDRCDAGWLADGSVRYPISRPRKRCSPTEAAVRFVGFPDKKHKLYGVYCFRSYQ